MVQDGLHPYLDSAQKICAQTNLLALKNMNFYTAHHASKKPPTSAMYRARSSQNGLWLLSSNRTHIVRGIR
jgi:hypothetical protein